MTPPPSPLEATERLAAGYASAEARRAAWRGAADVRRQVAREAGDDGDEALRQWQLVAAYEARARDA